MTGRERFLTALRRGEPDRVPLWELIVDEPVLSAKGAHDAFTFTEREDLDGVTVFECGTRAPLSDADFHAFALRDHAPVRPGTKLERDEWGIIWGTPPDGEGYPVAGPLAGPEDLARYRPPDPDDSRRLDSLREAVRRFKGKRAIVFMTHDGFEWSHYLRGGMEPLFEDWVERPEFALAIADLAVTWKIRLMEAAIRAGADVVVSGDDYAAGSGPMMSPAHFRTFVLPFLTRSVTAAHAAGALYIKHTDGQLWPIMEDLLSAGMDGLDPLEPKAGMDIGEVKRRIGGRVCLVGNLDCAGLLPRGTPADVEAAVRETIAKAASGGGYILASSNTIHPGVKPANYAAMVTAARRYGRYPLDPAEVAAWKDRDYMARWR